MGGPNTTDVHPDAPAGGGGKGNFRHHKSPGALGHRHAAHAGASPGKPPASPPATRHFEFRPRISFAHETERAALAGIRFPKQLSGKTVPGANYVSPTEMIKLLKERNSSKAGGSLSTVPGLTTAAFTLSFDNLAKQWQQTSAPNGAPQYKFLGGVVYLEVLITVHVQEDYRPPRKDKYFEEIFKIIYEHELEHVVDEIEIVANWLPAQAYKDEMVKKHLTDQPIPAQSYTGWIEGGHLQKWLHDGLWADEHNRRGDLRDSSAHYKELNEKIQDLRRKQANPNLKL